MDDISQVADRSITATDTKLDSTSQPFVGRWNQLISTTNWEKGHIILEWRDALIETDAPAVEYSDEAWSLRVGGVTGQHVGRLRRVYEHFVEVADKYEGLYWSHFQAALDWNDAEMWLEGAVQNEWSVSQMRRTRWETLGAVESDKPRDEDVVLAEVDEDFEPATDEASQGDPVATGYADVQSSPSPEGPDFDDGPAVRQSAQDGAAIYADEDTRETIEFVRPFENLAELPDDLADAFEAFKLAILRHKTEGWDQISRDDVLASLDALKELALAPSADDAPF
ncbi:MAG: hypothetical protein CMJ64_30045 [Planctomycetaceae bacterium]|nr:hypothetical protein [Planctomycetaceae bacterium]